MPGLRIDPVVLDALPVAERERVTADLVLVERAYKANPLLGYVPHQRQVEFHRAQSKTRLFLGGNRSGKTTCTMVDSILQAVDLELVPEALRPFRKWEPPFYCRTVTPDLTHTLDGVLLQKFRDWCPRSQLKGGSFDRAFDKVQRMLWFKNGSWFQFMSDEQDLNKFGGSALHRVVYDEEPSEAVRKENLARLIDFNGEELFGMTPLEGMSWIYDEFFEPWERGALERETAEIVVVDMDENPYIDAEGKKRALAAYSVEERQARKSGRFVSFSGLIYSTFSPRVHVLPTSAALPASDDLEATVPPGVEVFCGVDPGYRHMCAVVFCYLDADDRMVVFDEIAAKQETIRTVCDEIKLRCKRWGVTPRWTVIDPASRNKNGQTGRSDQQEFSDNGVMTIPGQNAVGPGINRVKERLEFRDANGESVPKLLVAAHCSELLGEFKRYRYVKESRRQEHESKDAPVKKDDHLLDALRYVVMQRPMRPNRDLDLPSTTMKDRLLRDSMKRLMGGRGQLPEHDSGAGIFS